MPRATIVEVANSTRENEKKCLPFARVNNFNHYRTMKIQMRNKLVMSKKRKE
jgi:hypothetical protein